MKEGFRFRDLFEAPELAGQRLSLLKRLAIVRHVHNLHQESGSDRPFLNWVWENREAIVQFILKILVLL